MRAGLETASMESIIDVILFDNPMKLKTNITETDISGNTEEMEWYIEKVEDNTIMYIEVLGDWYKQVVTEQYFFTKENLIAYIEPITELKQTGTEQINEKNTIRYDGVIKGNDIRKIAEAQSLLEIVEENLKDTNVSVDKVYQDIPDIPTFICIDEQGYIAKLELDLEDMIKSVSAKLAEQGNPDFDLEGLSMNVKLSFTCQNFNNATNFEIPEEARNGQEV